MKQIIHDLIEQALAGLQQAQQLPIDLRANIQVTPARNHKQGDFASNIAMMLAKQAAMPTRDLAKLIVEQIGPNEAIDKIEVAGPGFINFFITSDTSQAVVRDILQRGEAYGKSQYGKGQKVQVEFVSANPTGPLHVGHGRGAAYGATLAELLRYIGYDVQCEYYVNDAGRQMNILGTSTWLRYLELCGVEIQFPSNGYQGDYIWDIAATIRREHGDRFERSNDQVMDKVSADAP
ncbi:MAG: arginine--tRNA ligase, partial [Gammaproteobacteria bacterium]|nr:arginine--tRNA ligase [Gammaproteobacteria bacterium]